MVSLAAGSACGELEAAATQAVALVWAGEVLCALLLEECREVVEPAGYTALPGSPPWVLGLVNIRGRLLTVLDLGLWLGTEPAGGRPGYRVVVVEHGGRRLGLAVEGVVRLSFVEIGRGAPGRADLTPALVSADDAGRTTQPRVCALLELGAIFQAALG